MIKRSLYLTRPQLLSELGRCLSCPQKPCMSACPVNCNPQEFIRHARNNEWPQAIDSITRNNPMGQTCGLICPDKFCIQACTRAHLDFPINIPRVQATILKQYRPKTPPQSPYPAANGQKIAVIGAGPAGIAATAQLNKWGYKVTLFEAMEQIGGALNLIPDSRLPHSVIEQDWDYLYDSNFIELKLNTTIDKPEALLVSGYSGVIIASGEPNCVNLGVSGEEFIIPYPQYLHHPEQYAVSGNVAVIGGGAVATDCAITAKAGGAASVEMFVRRRLADMRVTGEERQSLIENGIDITTMTGISAVEKSGENYTLTTYRNRFNNNKLEMMPQTEIKRPDFALVIKAIGSFAPHREDSDYIIYAGDCKHGGSTIVEALASGKDAARLLHQKLSAATSPN